MAKFPASGGGGGGSVDAIESTDGSVTVTDPTGPTVDLTGAGTGAVDSVFGRTGVVAAAIGDYTVSEVTGAAALSGPTFTGVPKAPTAAPLTDDTQLATTGYTDAAVAVETARAETAEALLLPAANGVLTGTPQAPTAPPLTDDTQLATTAYTDAAVAAGTAGLQAGPLTGDVTTSAAVATVVPQQAIARGQDVTGRGARIGGSSLQGVGYRTTAGTYAAVTIATIITANVFNVAAAIGNGQYVYGNGTTKLGEITINVLNGSTAEQVVLSYTGLTATSYTGLTLMSGTSSWTVTTGAYVTHNTMPTCDVSAGCSIERGDGSVAAFSGGSLGVNDWFSVLNGSEQGLLGYPAQAPGFVFPIYSDTALYGSLEWATNSGTDVAATPLGSPSPSAPEKLTSYTTGADSTITCPNGFVSGQSITIIDSSLVGLNGTWIVSSPTSTTFVINNASSLGPGGAVTGFAQSVLVSSINLTTPGATVVGDTRHFRRLIVFGVAQTNGDGVKFATEGGLGTVVTSPTIDTNGSGLFCWDSGDLGWVGATGFTATWESHVSGAGGAGSCLIGALYIQSGGFNGTVPINISAGGTATGDWLNASAGGLPRFLEFLASIGMTPRHLFTGAQAVNDSLKGIATASQAATNLQTTIANILAASPLTDVDAFVCYNAGSASLPGVGVGPWATTWVPALRAAAIAAGATVLDMWAAFGDLSYTGDVGGLTEDNIHMGINTTSFSGRNGQNTFAKFVFEKLGYFRAFALNQALLQTGVAADGLFRFELAPAGAGTQNLAVFANSGDTQPVMEMVNFGGGLAGIGFGLGGSTAPDAVLLRTGMAKMEFASGAGVLATGTNAAASVIAGATSFAINAAGAQLEIASTLVTDRDAMVYIKMGTAGTAFSIQIGHTSAASDVTLWAAETPATGNAYAFRLPAGWYVIINSTSGVIGSQNAITC